MKSDYLRLRQWRQALQATNVFAVLVLVPLVWQLVLDLALPLPEVRRRFVPPPAQRRASDLKPLARLRLLHEMPVRPPRVAAPAKKAAPKPAPVVRRDPLLEQIARRIAVVALSRHTNPSSSTCILQLAGEQLQRFVAVGERIGTLEVDLVAVGGDFIILGRGEGRIKVHRKSTLQAELGFEAAGGERLRTARASEGLPGGRARPQPVRTEGLDPSDWSPNSVGLRYSGPARRGLQAGDVVYAVDGLSLATFEELAGLLRRSGPQHVLSLLRGGKLAQLIWNR